MPGEKQAKYGKFIPKLACKEEIQFGNFLQKCNEQLCPVFGKWSEWGTCDVTCGGGSQQRVRGCENGKLGDAGCPKGQETGTRVSFGV